MHNDVKTKARGSSHGKCFRGSNYGRSSRLSIWSKGTKMEYFCEHEPCVHKILHSLQKLNEHRKKKHNLLELEKQPGGRKPSGNAIRPPPSPSRSRKYLVRKKTNLDYILRQLRYKQKRRIIERVEEKYGKCEKELPPEGHKELADLLRDYDAQQSQRKKDVQARLQSDDREDMNGDGGEEREAHEECGHCLQCNLYAPFLSVFHLYIKDFRLFNTSLGAYKLHCSHYQECEDPEREEHEDLTLILTANSKV